VHKNNKHKSGYHFSALKKAYPELKKFIIKNPYNNQDSIDFSQSEAVKALNFSLLKSDYSINYWDIPDGYLCPPIPGRVDYLHHLQDLILSTCEEVLPVKEQINVLDIGTGASCIYPILGQRVYGWQFTASDIDPISLEQANRNLSQNKELVNNIVCRLQEDSSKVFSNIIQKDEFYHLTLCNPPFHESLAQATSGSLKKLKNLDKNRKRRYNGKSTQLASSNSASLNFGGQKAELWCKGGELAFIRKMITESKQFKQQVLWFTCLVSKKDNVSLLKSSLRKANATNSKVIKMEQGQKVSRFIAWTFHPKLRSHA